MKDIPKIIGIGGYEFAGKDTVAKVLMDLAGYNRLGLADALKELAYNLNPILRFKYKLKSRGLSKVEYKDLKTLVDQLGWDNAKKLVPVRKYLQHLGTEGCRTTFGEDIWLRTALERMEAQGGAFVIPDVRFPNEGQWVKDRANSLLLWVNREGRGPINNHASARGDIRALADYELDNNGTIEDLKDTLLALPPLRGIHQAIPESRIEKRGPIIDNSGWEAIAMPYFPPVDEESECTGDPGTCPLYATVSCSACVKDITG